MNTIRTEGAEEYGPGMLEDENVVSVVELDGHIYAERMDDFGTLETLTLVGECWVELKAGHA